MRRKPTRGRRTRAITEEAKMARRSSLLAAAGKLFASRDFADVSVDDIARQAALAKGTVYLYFGTKEALFLQLVSEEMRTWLTESTARLAATSGGPGASAAAVAATLSERPTLVRLLALLHAVLEHNSDLASVGPFKRRLLEITTEAGALFERTLGLTSGTGARLTLWMHATIVGLAQMTATSPALSKLLADDEALAVFRLDFHTELEAALTSLFVGAQQRFAAAD